MNKTEKNFFIFLLVNLFVWSMVPLLRLSLPMDTQEALIWGRDFFFGTPKHPPFSGWLAWPFYTVFAHFDIAMYLLSQICVAMGVIYIYRLAKSFIGEQKAVLAAMLQFGVIFYDFSSVEYNVNVVSLALWPMCAFYFWQALQKNKWGDWLLFGLLAGLNLLNKYTGGFLLFAFAVFVIYDKTARGVFKNPKAYIAAILALWVFMPHIYWLYQTDFASFNYFFGRSSGGKYAGTLLGHIIYPLKFTGAQLLFCAATLISYAVFYYKSEKQKFSGESMKSNFLVVVGVVPFCMFLLMGIIKGTALKSMWGFPLWFLLGISLIYFKPFNINETKAKKMFFTFVGWSMLFAVVYAIQCLFTTSQRFQENNQKTVDTVLQEWKKMTDISEPEYVAADVWYADMFALKTGSVKPFYWFDVARNPDVSDEILQKPMLVVAVDENEYNGYVKKYGEKLSKPRKLTVEMSNYFGKIKSKDIYYGFYNLKDAKNGK